LRYDLAGAGSFATTFCRTCGAPLPYHTRSDREIVVPAGSLNDLPAMQPQGPIFRNSRLAWTCSGDGLATYAEYSDSW